MPDPITGAAVGATVGISMNEVWEHIKKQDIRHEDLSKQIRDLLAIIGKQSPRTSIDLSTGAAVGGDHTRFRCDSILLSGSVVAGAPAICVLKVGGFGKFNFYWNGALTTLALPALLIDRGQEVSLDTSALVGTVVYAYVFGTVDHDTMATGVPFGQRDYL